MILEVAILDIKSDQDKGFEAAFSQAQSIISGMTGTFRINFKNVSKTLIAISYW